MLKRTINYTDFNDQPQSDEFYFHLSKAELVRLEFGVHGGLEAALKKMIESEDKAEILAIFEKIVQGSYGIKSEDGKNFLKTPAILSDFQSSAAYDALFTELITDEKEMAKFINGIIPKDLVAMMAGTQPQDKPAGSPPLPPSQ